MQPPSANLALGDYFVGDEEQYRQWLKGLEDSLHKPQKQAAASSAKEERAMRTVNRMIEAHRAGQIPYSIDLSNSGINLAGLHTLMESLPYGAQLCELYLSNTRVTDEGAFVIAKSMDRFPFLNTIYLSGNIIADRGCCALASALNRNTSVTNLDLYMNKIGDAGAIALAKMLRGNGTLSVLNLKGNLIATEGHKALAQAMVHNATIQQLSMDENNASDDGKALESIINSLGVNTDPKQQIKLHFKRLNFLRQAEDLRPDLRAYVNRTDFSDLALEPASGGGPVVAHRAVILGSAPSLYKHWCPDLNAKVVSGIPLSRAALLCLLEHIYAQEVVFLDLSADDVAALRYYAKEHGLDVLAATLSDAASLDVIPPFTLSQTAFLSQPELSDVDLMADDNPNPIKAHRVILAARSQYFYALFTSGLKETSESVVKLAKPRSLVAAVVEFCYTGDVQVIDSSIAIDLLLASLEYRLPGLQQLVESMVADAVDAENLADLTALAEEHDLSVLLTSCRLFGSDAAQQQQQAAPPPPPHPPAAAGAAGAAAAAADAYRAPSDAAPQPWQPRERADIRQTCIVQ